MPHELAGVREDWRGLPKIDLHRHLEGAIPLDLIQRLAAESRIPLPTDHALLAELVTFSPSDNPSVQSFLAPFEHIRKVFQTEEIIKTVAAEVTAAAAMEGVHYLELHITPSALVASSGADVSEAVGWVCQAVQESADANDITTNIIISLNRHEPVTAGEAAIQAALDWRDDGVVGVDLAGDESQYDARPFSSLLQRAREAGLKISLHAGEWAGPESVAFAMKEIQADRIVHGVRIMEDQDLVRLAQMKRVPLVVCLTSNLQSGVVESFDDHPLPHMLAAGLQVSLATDDPSISRTTLADEFEIAQRQLGLGPDSVRGMMLAATQAAFLPDRDKRELEARFQEWLGLAPQIADANQQKTSAKDS